MKAIMKLAVKQCALPLALLCASAVQAQIMTNVALASAGAVASAPSEFTPGTTQCTIDGNTNAYSCGWASVQSYYPWTLTVTLAKNTPIVRIHLVEDSWDPAYSTSGSIQYYDGSTWQVVSNFSKSSPGLDFTLSTPITTSKLRFVGSACVTPSGWYNKVPVILEFEAYAITEVPVLPRLDIRVSQVELCWQTVTNMWYQVQYRSTLTTNQWTPLTGTWIAGDGTRYCTTDAIVVGIPQRFYQLAVTNSAPQ